MDIHLLIYLILGVAPIGTFIHEAGHALGAKSLNADRIQLSLGTGRKIGCFSAGKISISLRAVYFLGGLAYSERNRGYTDREKIWIATCGPLGNLIFAVLLFIIYSSWSGDYLLLPVLFNLWVAVINLVPFQFKGRQSDGYVIFKVLTEA